MKKTQIKTIKINFNLVSIKYEKINKSSVPIPLDENQNGFQQFVKSKSNPKRTEKLAQDAGLWCYGASNYTTTEFQGFSSYEALRSF